MYLHATVGLKRERERERLHECGGWGWVGGGIREKGKHQFQPASINFCVCIQFRYATGLDWLLMIIGTLVAILHGFVLPIALLVLAFLTDAFVFREVSRKVANIQYFVSFQYLLSLKTSGAEGKPLELGELADYNANPDLANIPFDVKNLTGGVVNCSGVYTFRLPYPYDGQLNFTIADLVRSATVPTAKCYTNETFIDYINALIFGLLAVIILAAALGAVQMLFFHLTSERQMRKMRLYYFQSILRQERKWHDLQTQGELGIHLSEYVIKFYIASRKLW